MGEAVSLPLCCLPAALQEPFALLFPEGTRVLSGPTG